LPIGPPTRGPIAQRHDLAHLRADPPPPGAVVAMTALTAPAAVVLHELGVKAICCEHGGALSHAALMCRELRLSALLGCRGCTTIPDGTPVLLDTHRGVLRRTP
jgi:phosphoenolpyruvate-protein kinase (PTS system EI component)